MKKSVVVAIMAALGLSFVLRAGSAAYAAPRVRDHRVPFGEGRARLHYPRYHEYELKNVKIVVSFAEKEGDVFGDTTNTVTLIRDDTRYVDFDSAGLHYTSVTSGGKPLRYQTFGETLRVYLPAPASAGTAVAIEARYRAHPTKGVYFVRPDKWYPDRPWEVWSQGEMIDNHFWFPTYDWPDEKASSETVTTVPEGQTVVSNGRLAKVVHDRKAGTVTYDWIEPVPHSTYLISIVAGTFAQYTDHLGSLPVTYYAPPASRQTVAYDFRATPKMIDFFSKFNGVPYPYDKYAQSAVVDFTYGGMENISATTQTARTLHDRRSELDGDSEGLVAHELAHQWWGDLETMEDWGQVWLNEGYATYYEALYRQHAHGQDAFDMDRLDMMTSVFDEDRRYRRPIVTEVYAAPEEVFDSVAYEKAGLVLHMLRTALGTDLYRKAQTAFLTQYEAKTANTAQWEAAVEGATGRDLHWFVDEWLYGAGFPEYSVRYTYDPAAKTVTLAVDQTQSTAWNTPAVFTMPIPIEIRAPGGAAVRTTVQDDQRHQTFSIPVPEKPLLVLFDPGRNILSVVRFPKSRAELEYQMQHAGSVLDRLDAATKLAERARLDSAALASAGWFLTHEPYADARAAFVGSLASHASDARVGALLRNALSDSSAHVRAAAAGALSAFRTDPRTIAALKAHAAMDASYATIAASVRALADLHAPGVSAVLARALAQPSNNGEIASSALYGYAGVSGKGAIPLEERYARYGAPYDTRGAAIRALGRIGKRDHEVAAFLSGLLGDPDLSTNFNLLRALQSLGDASALPAVERLAVTTEDERLRQFSLETAKAIEAQQHHGKKASAGKRSSRR